MNFTVREIELLLEALARAASRLESQARFNPRTAGPHDRKAAAMRALRERLCRAKMGVKQARAL